MYLKRVPWVRIPLSPPSSLRLQRLCGRYQRSSQKLPRFRGSWETGTAESAPETASCGPKAGSWSRLSLLPSLAVPIRFRFAPEGVLEVRIARAGSGPPAGGNPSRSSPRRGGRGSPPRPQASSRARASARAGAPIARNRRSAVARSRRASAGSPRETRELRAFDVHEGRKEPAPRAAR